MKTIAFRSRLLIETMLIVAACEGGIMLLLPLVLPGESYWLEAVADTSLLALTAGPLLYWRFGLHHKTQATWQRAEIERQTAELIRINTSLLHEGAERERAQSFLNSVVENLPITVFIKEANELRFVLWNKAGEQLTGIPPAEMIGKNDRDFFPQADAELYIANDRAAFAKRGVLEIPEEIIQTRKQGARITRVRKVPLFDAAGQPAFLLGISEDITERKQAEAALHQSEDRFRLLVEESPDAIGIYQDGKLVFINSTGIRLMGGKVKEDFLGLTSEQLIHPDDLADASDRVRRRLAGETGIYPAEVRYLRLGGTIVQMEVSAAAIILDGKPAVQFIARDITERKRAQQLIAENERHLRLILESVPECIKLIAADGTVLSMNSAGLAMVELESLDQVVGRLVHELVLPRYGPVLQALNAAVFRGESKTAEYEMVGLKGTHRWMETCAGPLRNGEGQIIAQLAVTRDITQRKQAEELLRLQEAALRSAANVVVITDRQGLIVWTNPAFTKVTGFTAAEVLGQNPRVLKRHAPPPVPPARFYQELWQTITRGEVWQGEFHNARKDGTPLIEEATITPVRNEKGQITHFVAVKQDITERQRAATELERVHRQLLETSRLAGMTEVATNVLHNVGNVLNSVNISAALVVDSVKQSKLSSLARIAGLFQEHAADLGEFITADPKGRQLPAYLSQLSDHLLAEQKATVAELVSLRGNVEHIKEIVAMQQNYATVVGVKEIINVVNLVEDSLRINAEALNQQRVELIREFETVPLLNLEKHKLLQILVNLLRNAKHACQDSERPDRRLTVRVSNGAGRVRIAVTDNGIGIPPENLTRIFNYGFTTRKDGHGFGLHGGALAAKEMGGALTAQSDGPGLGATFTLELPCPTGKNPHE